MATGQNRHSRFLADKVRQLRLERGWSVRFVADQCLGQGQRSLTRSALAKIEAGQRGVVTIDEAVVLARVLGVRAADLAAPENVNHQHLAQTAPTAQGRAFWQRQGTGALR